MPFGLALAKLKKVGAKMIAYITGKILQKTPTQSIIDCQGVGYEVFHTPYTAEKMQSASVSLHIHNHIREDAFQLFGFFSVDEKNLFKDLLKVSSVGPKLALSILSGIQYQELITALHNKDIQRLQKIPGIGKKTAERLSIELADKVMASLGSKLSPATQELQKETELESVLLNLGYQKSDITKVIPKVREFIEVEALEVVVKKALGELTKARMN